MSFIHSYSAITRSRTTSPGFTCRCESGSPYPYRRHSSATLWRTRSVERSDSRCPLRSRFRLCHGRFRSSHPSGCCGKFLRQHPDVLRDFLGYLRICLCQLSMVVLYSGFYSVFANLSPPGQTKFVLLLPVIKLFENNLFRRFLRNCDDVKPEVVIFNVELSRSCPVACSGRHRSR